MKHLATFAFAFAFAIVISVIGAIGWSRPTKPVGIADPDLLTLSAPEQAREYAQMRSIGMTSVRLDARWDWVQHAGPDTFDWHDLDQAVTAARDGDLSVVLVMSGCPEWAAAPGSGRRTPAVPAAAEQFAAWASMVASRYARQDVHTFEIWNEPNNVRFWGPTIDAAAYTAILKATYVAVKAADPRAFVISGGLSPAAGHPGNQDPVQFLETMYAHGAKDSFDAVGYHPYSYPALPSRFESRSGWSQMAQTRPSVRSVMVAHGDGSTAVWITEVGAPARGPHGVGEAAQSGVVSEVLARVRTTEWIGAVYVYTWRDRGTNPGDDEDWFGVLTVDGRPKPAYASLRRALEQW